MLSPQPQATSTSSTPKTESYQGDRVRRWISSSSARPPPQEVLARQSTGRSPPESSPPPESTDPASSKQIWPAPPQKASPRKEEDRWRGEEGHDQKKTLVTKPTNVPTPAELAPHQPHRARHPVDSASPTPTMPPRSTVAGSRHCPDAADHDPGRRREAVLAHTKPARQGRRECTRSSSRRPGSGPQ
jgi:hypothetical protein